MSYGNGYGPSLADQGYGPDDVEDAFQERMELIQANETRTGWAYPGGKAEDARVRLHYFENDGASLCGRWPAPGSHFDVQPYGDGCTACERALEKRSPPATA